MTSVIRIVCWADGRPTGLDGQYLCDWSQNIETGRLDVLADPEPMLARHFDDAGAALTYWRQQSTERPLRTDGKPNRPLTALTVEILDLEKVLDDLS